MKNIFLVVIFLCALQSFTQSKSFQISGTLISEEDKRPLESATVYLERIKDSSLVTYTISDKNGEFDLEGKVFDKTLTLFVSYVGYKTYTQSISIDKPQINLKQINLEIDTNALDEVLIKSRAPISIKKDTLEFNVKSFKTKKDANVEDLLKKLPGVEVDTDGKIKVNGKPVNNILVNGQPFFGNDQTIVTKNLTKDIIEKVQITDTKTRAQAFAGEEGDPNSKTINLTIKKENSKSVFGRLAAGGGTDKRFELAGLVSVFNDKQRISVLGGSNNINSPGFSFGDINRMARGGGNVRQVRGYRYGSNRGITTSRNAGVNYIDKYGKSTDLSSSYFYSGSNSESDSRSNRENFLPNSRYFTESTSNNYSETSNHSVDLGFDIKIDSTLFINIKPKFSYSKNLIDNKNTLQSNDTNNVLTNESTSNSFSKSSNKDLSNSITITKNLKRKGAFLRLRINNNLNSSETDNYFNSKINIYGTLPFEENRNQFIDREGTENTLVYSLRYRTPIIKDALFLDLIYNNSHNKRTNTRSTYDSENNGQDFTVFNEDLSTDFKYIEKNQMPVIEFMYSKGKLYFKINGGYKFRTLENKDKLRPVLSLNKNFEHFEQTIDFRYKFSPSKSLNLNYYSANTPPQISQLQPFEDVSNPLNIIKGNPELSPSNRHVISLWFQNYNMQKKSGFYMHLRGIKENKKVTVKSSIDENFVRTSTYANVNGNYNVSGGFGYNRGIKIDSLRTINLQIGFNGNINKSVNFNNDVLYAAQSKMIGPNARVYFDWRNIMQFRTNYSISFSNTEYSLNNFEDQKFMVHNLETHISTTFFKKLEWQNEINFSYNPNVSTSFQKSAWFWNATLSYSIAKDKGLLGLKAYDVLNQNTNARRIITQNYIEDSQSTILRQYFMLSFSWKFNSLTKSK